MVPADRDGGTSDGREQDSHQAHGDPVHPLSVRYRTGRPVGQYRYWPGVSDTGIAYGVRCPLLAWSMLAHGDPVHPLSGTDVRYWPSDVRHWHSVCLLMSGTDSAYVLAFKEMSGTA
eukprot:3716919-Rhodomonas_salina.3